MFRVEFTHKPKNREPRVVVKEKASIASATNLIHKVHSSLSHNLIKLELLTNNGWVEYDMPWMNTHAAVKARLYEVTEFHEIFYEGVA